eukprot:PhM_4_TR1327/c5_g1_i1/m.101136/K00931/proB; glutamate 5-kinase
MSSNDSLSSSPTDTSNIIVIKIGSNSLVDGEGKLDVPYLQSIASQVVKLRDDLGLTPVIVSSGAAALGMNMRGFAEKPAALGERHALPAIGQIGLMAKWEEAFAAHGVNIAQLLLTHDDFSNRERHANLMDTLRAILAWGIVPIMNENDPISNADLTVGDNDQLSALVASQIEAKHLVLLTDVPGVYDRDPRGNPDAKLLKRVPVVTPELLAMCGSAGSRGRGGMHSKIESARLAAAAGVTTVIALAREEDVLRRAVLEEVGTTIPGMEVDLCTHKRWLGLARRVKGRIHLSEDADVEDFVRNGGSTVHPEHIERVEGEFASGDTVSIHDPQGLELARGLVKVDAEELNGTSADSLSQLAVNDGIVSTEDMFLLATSL